MPPPILCLATRNAHKIAEMTPLLAPYWEVKSSADYPEVIEEVEETGDSFLANATLKAVLTSQALPEEIYVLADDSGLEVDLLEGAPGIFSARYGGIPSSSAKNNAKLLQELARLEAQTPQERSGRFTCVLALARGGEFLAEFRGVCEGMIAREPRGEHGFGYDPLFIPQGQTQTFGQLDDAVKAEISHRALAIRAFLEWSRTEGGQE